jgi:type II secretion system protein H
MTEMNLWPALTPTLKECARPRAQQCLSASRLRQVSRLSSILPSLRPGTGALRITAAFTLIELLLVMALLLIVLAVSFPSLRGFFRGRHLDHEARRFLSLTRYAQNRAVSEGYPMVLWVDVKEGTYGMQAQTGYLDEDDKSVEYEIDGTLELEVTRPMLIRTTAMQRNETASVAGNLPAIRFTPDGFYTDSSPERIVIRQDEKDEVVIVKSENRLSYEIQTSNQQVARR